jgi:hypothetical protein
LLTALFTVTGNNGNHQNSNQPGNWRGPPQGGGRWQGNQGKPKFKKPQGQGQRQSFNGQNNDQQSGPPPQQKGGKPFNKPRGPKGRGGN